MATATKWTRHTAKNPCPVCGSTKGECRSDESRPDGRVQTFCRGKVAAPSGWGHIGSDAHGFDIYLDQWDGDAKSLSPEEIERRVNERAAAQQAYVDGLVPLSERHAVFFSQKLLAVQALTDSQRAELTRRGWSTAWVDFFESLGWLRNWAPGVSIKHPTNCPGFGRGKTSGNAGMMVAAVHKGMVAGGQIKPTDPIEGAKYVWLSRDENAGLKEFQGEMPLFLWRHPDAQLDSIEITEGALKSATFAQKLWSNGQINSLVIGAGGSNWASSEQQIRKLLAAVKPQQVILNPDSGAIANAHVSRQMEKLAALVKDAGHELHVRWWGQLAKEPGRDPDEISRSELTAATLLTWEQFVALSDQPDPTKPAGCDWSSPVSHEGRLGFWVTDKAKLAELKAQGLWEDGDPQPRKFSPSADYDFQIHRNIAGEGGGGYELLVKVYGTDESKIVFLPATEQIEARQFNLAMIRGVGESAQSKLSTSDCNGILANRKAEYRARGGKTYRHVDGVGRQKDGTYVFQGIQFNPDGSIADPEETLWVYRNRFQLNDGGDKSNVKDPKIATPNDAALTQWCNAVTKFFGPSGACQALFMAGFVAAGLHFDEILEIEGRFPTLNAVGAAGTKKTIAMQAAMSLFGGHDSNVVTRVTTPRLYDLGHRYRSLCIGYDDPDSRDSSLEETLKAWYNGSSREVTGKVQEPHSPIMVTSNHAIGESHPATMSRILQVPFFADHRGNGECWDELKEAMGGASGGIGKLIALGYPRKEIREYATMIRCLLPQAHARVADNLALIGWYAKAVARLGGFSEEAIDDYIFATLCPLYNDADKAGDPIRIFLGQLSALRSTNSIGRWNVIPHTTRDGEKWLAVNLTSVWPEIDRQFRSVYSRDTITMAVLQAGGKKSTARFHATKDESLTFERDHARGLTNTKVSTVPARCLFIPISLVKDYSLDLSEAPTVAQGQAHESEATHDEPTEPAQVETVAPVEPAQSDTLPTQPIAPGTEVMAVIAGYARRRQFAQYSDDGYWAGVIDPKTGMGEWVEISKISLAPPKPQ
jgi:hypothetical protein